MKVLFSLLLFCFLACASEGYLFVEGSFDANERWTTFSKDDRLNVKNLVQHLAKSPSGRDLLLKAKRKASRRGLTLLDVIKPGSGSLTDTTLIRKFSPRSPEHIVYETRSVVYVNRSLNQYDAILDLAHELTHFVYRREFNPYKVNFNLSEFIKNTIEGEGGEARAFVGECKVLNELFPSKYHERYNCGKIKGVDGKISQDLAVQKFYQIGDFEDPFRRLLLKEGIIQNFPSISSKEVSFVSSAYGVPYPVAAYKEYKAVMTKVCANDKKRIAYMAQTKGRSPASALENDWKQKCSRFD